MATEPAPTAPRLAGKICVITGGASGIGRAIAERFHAEGGTVILTDVDGDAGAATAAAIGCTFQPLDVRDEADWTRLADAADRKSVV